MFSAPLNEDPDHQLVEMAQDGDLSAFDELVKRHSARLYAHVYHMTSNSEDAYDLLQDVFAKAYRSLKRFRGNSSFYTWVYSIATNMSINHLKRKNRKQAMSLDQMDNGISNDLAFADLAVSSNPHQATQVKELQKKLNEALQALSNEHRSVVVMFDIEGLAHKEIAKILGLSQGTVRSRLHYAHRQLQGILAEYLL